ncbi:unnamed protein product [Cuscuta epithymum]|uniref:Uncharacterized protein n=1 Tax=Cuscuta epithymum TaxID=186058 RepID=A0AAV0DMS0_9ASTE|nr:unnamed protein product [Cuscuta epithymum]
MMFGLQRLKVVQGRKMNVWSTTARDHGRTVGLEAGTDLDLRSSVLGGDKGGLVENRMNKRQGDEEATVLLDRPPPEPLQWGAGESRV